MNAAIRAVDYYLPETVLSTADLSREFPGWSVEKIDEKTGIQERHIAHESECASDLGCRAAQKLFASGVCDPGEIDYLLFCTQSPDYFLPTTACLLQHRLGLSTSAGALDFNLGCSGFVYGLGLAKGLIETRQARKVLLITAETYSKFIHPGDKGVRTIFGDGAAATLVAAVESEGDPLLGPFVFGTDGAGAGNLIVPTGGLRNSRTPESAIATEDESGNWRSKDNLFMHGGEIFNFTLRMVPKCVSEVLAKASLAPEDVDLYVFHQANQFMLDHLRKKLRIPAEKFCIALRTCANTVSSTIPIALKMYAGEGRITPGQRVLMVGFGVGYSWGACLARWM